MFLENVVVGLQEFGGGERRKRHQFGGSTAISPGLLSMTVALIASLSEGSTSFLKGIWIYAP